MLLQLCCFLLVAVVVSAYTDQGVVYVDDLTFYKVVDGSKPALVRFDKEYTWGDEHDQFKELAKQVGEGSNNVLVVSLPISKGGDKTIQIAESYGIEETEWPAFRLFKQGVTSKDKPLAYTGAKTSRHMLQWLAENTGAFFGLKGQILAFEQLIQKYADSSEPDKVLQEAKTLPLHLTDEEKGYADYYVKTFQRLADKGLSYVVSEQKRLNKLLEDKNIASDKKATFQPRLNILSSFATKLKVSEQKAEL